MRDQRKNTNQQLIQELNALRGRISEMEATLAQDALVRERFHLVNSLKEDLLRQARLTDKLKLITDSVVRIFEADFSRIWIVSPGDRCNSGCVHAKVTEEPHVCRYRDRCLHLVASSGRYTQLDGKMHSRTPFDCYKIGRIASGSEPKFMTNDVVNDRRVHDRAWARKLGLVSFAGYRILADDSSPIGVLALFSKTPLSNDDDLLLEGIANTTAQVFQAAKMEEALEIEKRRFQALADNSPFGMIIIEPDGTFSYANPKFKEMFGYDQKEVPNGREWFRKAYPDAKYRHGVISEWIKDYKDAPPGESRPRVYSTICKDGGEKIVHFRTVRLDSGQDLMTCEDITELKRDHDALIESEKKYRTVVERADEGIMVSQDGMIRFVNPKAANIIGYEELELLERPFSDFIHSEDRDKVLQRHLKRLELVSKITATS
ncbi:MAG: PAS domain S-box protein [Desulfomonilaceae bacterium]